MKYLEIARIINTHGLLGEVRVLCNFYGQNFTNWKPKQLVFLKDNTNYQPLIIEKVRTHKNWLLITFEQYYKIDLVLFMKNKALVIINDDNTQENNFLFENLINYQAINNHSKKIFGTVIELIDNNHSGLWKIIDQQNNVFYVPNNQFFIIKVDKKKKQVFLNLISGMFNYE